ncbi:phage major capsid protein [Algiphilus aromaticivorans]|uniref:phage major capsid protein n=1 Tax=Algiphilus aromaticivorans TaxID=382454 RepID=UPI000694467A|nr:phage major capsid protein [Algiphilus aromaticivorans]
MDLNKQVGETVEAVKGFKHRIDTIEEDVGGLSERLKGIEQHSADGFKGVSPSGGGSNFADQVRQSEGFKAFVEGNSRHAKMTLSGSLLAKNTILGEGGSPQNPDATLVDPTRRAGIVAGAFRQLRIRDVLNVLPTASNQIEYSREASWTNNAAGTAEGETKPESDLTFELKDAPVRTIAHWIKVSKQVLSDQAALAQLIDRRMRHGVQLAEEVQILTGNGTGQNLSGLLNAGNFTSVTPQTGDTKLDTLRRAITTLQRNDWMASAMVLHPDDWEAIELLKDTQDRYLFASPQQAAMPQLWGLPVVATNSVTQGSFIVADFPAACTLWDRQQPVVELFEQDDDDVQRNLVTIRAEERIAFTVERPAAVAVGDFA